MFDEIPQWLYLIKCVCCACNSSWGKMADYVRFLIFAHGNIISGSLGPEYDRPPVKKVKVRVGTSFIRFVRVICEATGIDHSTNRVEIVHRHPIYMPHGVSYFLVTIGDDDDLEGLMEMAKENGNERIQCLYIRTCESSNVTEEDHMTQETQENPSTTAHRNTYYTHPNMEMQNAGPAYEAPVLDNTVMGIESSYEPVAAAEMEPQLDVEAEQEQVDDPEYDDHMLVDHNIVFQESSASEEDDDQEEHADDGGGTSSNPQAVRDAIPYYNHGGDSGLCEYDDYINAMCSGHCATDDLKKGMRFNTKDELVCFVKQWHADNQRDYTVRESKSSKWDIYCKEKEKQGCNWRLRACKKKIDGIFVISILEGPPHMSKPSYGAGPQEN